MCLYFFDKKNPKRELGENYLFGLATGFPFFMLTNNQTRARDTEQNPRRSGQGHYGFCSSYVKNDLIVKDSEWSKGAITFTSERRKQQRVDILYFFSGKI